jgi:hypothetical protein
VLVLGLASAVLLESCRPVRECENELGRKVSVGCRSVGMAALVAVTTPTRHWPPAHGTFGAARSEDLDLWMRSSALTLLSSYSYPHERPRAERSGSAVFVILSVALCR